MTEQEKKRKAYIAKQIRERAELRKQIDDLKKSEVRK